MSHPSSVVAQESHTQQQGRPTVHSTLVGIGGVRQLDTYLSPQNYRGPQLHFLHETFRRTHHADGRISVQTLWQGNVSYTDNSAANAHFIGGDISFDAAWHYSLVDTRREKTTNSNGFQLLLGPQIGANGGFLYSTRNGNNPAQALACVRLSASASAIYGFHLWRQPFVARYQLDLPLIGMKFSPNYGQSYYEIFSLGHYDHNICATHPFNAFSTRHLLTLDVPLRRTTLRVGYLCDLRQSHVNELKYHSYSHAFVIGVVRHLTIHRPAHRSEK